jgi:hypothetical protein
MSVTLLINTTREVEDLYAHKIIDMHERYLQKMHVEGKVLPRYSE